jgi:tetratricopeptide (TPR) repeat protein
MVERFPAMPVSHYSLGDAFLDNSLVDEAIVALRFAIALQPKYVRALTTLSEAYQMIYLHDSALYFLDSALVCNPSNAQAHFQRAELLNDMGRRVDAIASYKEWAMLQPFNSAPWVKLGQAQIVVGDYIDALETLGYALSLKDEIDPLVHFLIAQANEGLGRVHEARNGYADFFLRFPTHKKAMEAEERARTLGWSPMNGGAQ